MVFSLTTLTSLLLLNYIAKRFGDLVGKGLSWGVIGKFFGLSIPFTVALTFPMAVLVATLYAFGRLAAENEITALKASGVSLRAILAPVLVAAFGITLLMIVFNDQIMPRSNHMLAKLQMDIAQKKPTFALREQVINEIQSGRLYLRANHIDEGSNRMGEVTIYDLTDATRRRTIYADSGTLAMAPNKTDLLMTLYDGTMQDVPTDKPSQLQRLFFNVDLIVTRGVANKFEQDSSGYTTKGDREMTVCEMQQEVDHLERDYEFSRQSFLQNVELARATNVKLSPEIENTNTSIPSRYTLGRAYCQMLTKTGLRELEARPVPDGLDSLLDSTVQPAKIPSVISKIVADSTKKLATDSSVKKQDTVKKDTASKDSSDITAAAGVGRKSTASPTPRPVGSTSTPSVIRQVPVKTLNVIANSDTSARPAHRDSLMRDSLMRAMMAHAAATGQPLNPDSFPDSLRQMMQNIPQMPTVDAGMLEMERQQMMERKLAIVRYDVEIHKKFALAVACFVFALLGAPIALRFPRGGVGMTIGVSLIVFALYYVGLIAGSALATAGHMPAWIAMWMANVLFAAVAIYMLSQIGKEGTTARGGDLGDFVDRIKPRLQRLLRPFGLFSRERDAT